MHTWCTRPLGIRLWSDLSLGKVTNEAAQQAGIELGDKLISVSDAVEDHSFKEGDPEWSKDAVIDWISTATLPVTVSFLSSCPMDIVKRTYVNIDCQHPKYLLSLIRKFQKSFDNWCIKHEGQPRLQVRENADKGEINMAEREINMAIFTSMNPSFDRLLPDWEEKKSDDGKATYENSEGNEVTYPEGTTFYENSKTGKTKWERPYNPTFMGLKLLKAEDSHGCLLGYTKGKHAQKIQGYIEGWIEDIAKTTEGSKIIKGYHGDVVSGGSLGLSFEQRRDHLRKLMDTFIATQKWILLDKGLNARADFVDKTLIDELIVKSMKDFIRDHI